MINVDAAEVAEHIGIDRRRAVNYHSDEIGTQKIYGAMSKFVSFAMGAPPMDALDDDSWREDLDEDFKSRKKKSARKFNKKARLQFWKRAFLIRKNIIAERIENHADNHY